MKKQAVRRDALEFGWKHLLGLDSYNQSSALTVQEQEAITRFVQQHQVGTQTDLRREVASPLERLWGPVRDALTWWGSHDMAQRVVWQILLREMGLRRTSFWAWSQEEWAETIGSTREAFRQRYAYDSRLGDYRQEILVTAYLLGNFTSFSLLAPGSFPLERTARRMFGDQLIDAAVERISGVLLGEQGWGYSATPACRKDIVLALCLVFLVNRTPHLESISEDLLARVHSQAPHIRLAHIIVRLSQALVALQVIEKALPNGNQSKPILERLNAEGIASEWLEWCQRWYHLSTLALRTKNDHLYILYKAGRWLAATHPEITSPTQWTAQIAAEWVQTVDIMKVGEWVTEPSAVSGKVGKPILPRSKAHHLIALNTFFRDLQEGVPDFPENLTLRRALRIPKAILRLIGPDPRDIDTRWWAMLVHAAQTLTEQDLPRSHAGHVYPLALVRALAIVWVYSGLRSDEIIRLRVGCIRWQHEDVTIPETGETLPKEAVCFLSVPVNKTEVAFIKPVNPIVGKVINEWEHLRPARQPGELDKKTNEVVQFLFSYRGHPIPKSFINRILIPLLCDRAGLPHSDERGSITSHRARATIATLLYNAPEGMSIWELMHWLGHKHPNSTQNYARMKPTKLASAYSKADRTSRLIEVLVDTQADAQGQVHVYYVLGDHGLCSNADWASCLYRMACMKCPFFVPQERAQLIRARKTIKRFMEMVELTQEEEEAARDDLEKLDAAIKRTPPHAAPQVLRQRAKGSSQRGIPLPVINVSRGDAKEEDTEDDQLA